LPSILFILSNAFAGGICNVPTTAGQVIFPANWHDVPYLYVSNEEVNQGETVDTWVVATWPYPPYYWSLSGEDFSLQKGETKDLEVNKLSAGSYACGAATIKVMDSLGQGVTGYVRSNIGTWVLKGNYCGLSGSVSCYRWDSSNFAEYVLTEGNKKQYQGTELTFGWKIWAEPKCCTYCENWYNSNPCSNTTPNCIDGDHNPPGLAYCDIGGYVPDCVTNPCRRGEEDCFCSRYAWGCHFARACVRSLKYWEYECP